MEQLSNYNIEYPMIFKITNDRTGVSSHCGVLEFSAKEGVTFVPGWVRTSIFVMVSEYNNLLVDGNFGIEGGRVCANQ